jgi:hypothetical protein
VPAAAPGAKKRGAHSTPAASRALRALWRGIKTRRTSASEPGGKVRAVSR